MRYRKLGSSDLEVSEISRGSWMTFAGALQPDTFAAIDSALGDAPVTAPTPAPLARAGVTRR